MVDLNRGRYHATVTCLSRTEEGLVQLWLTFLEQRNVSYNCYLPFWIPLWDLHLKFVHKTKLKQQKPKHALGDLSGKVPSS